MVYKTVIVVSKEDTASCNIKTHLLEKGDWTEYKQYDSEPSYTLGDCVMISIDDIHLYYDNVDRKVEEQLGFKPELIIYASRHRSESKLKTLTLHPLGNYTEAKFGGIPGRLVPTAPRKMTQALRTLTRNGSGLEHKISYEATHHGPYLETPTFFIEIGSDETAWVEQEPADAIARTLLAVLSEPADEKDRLAIGVGGGHYVPRLTEVALEYHIAFGHMIPTYALDMPKEMFSAAISATPGVECVYFHKKFMKKAKYREIKTWMEENTSLLVVDSKSLEKIGDRLDIDS